MAIYAIGDLQGCLDPLHQLLDRVRFDPARDHLWFVGDLVNRGPQSLETLRFVRSLNREMGDRVITTLGNHDLFLLSCAYTERRPRKKDTIDEILNAPDSAELIDWLRRQKLLHRDAPLGWTMVHAGLPREWTLEQAAEQAREVEAELCAPDPSTFLEQMFGDEPACWADAEAGDRLGRLRYTVNALTRIRYCHVDGQLELEDKRPPGEAASELLPWFRLSNRASSHERVVFGHWSSLGANLPQRPTDDAPQPGLNNTWCIDQGCIWGGGLTALRLDAWSDKLPRTYQIPCPGYRKIKD